MIRWPLLPGLVRPMIVVVRRVGPQHRPQVRLTIDQHPVRALGPHGPHPAFGITIRPRCPWRRVHHSYARAREDLVEYGGELGVAVADKEPERADPVTTFISRFRACCAVQAPSGWTVTPST
jgi:hypothetical protein